jgi:hypothetical protein
MATTNTFICKCGQWNRSPAPNFGRLICWNCGNAIISVAPNASGVTLRGLPIGPLKTTPPPPAQDQPKPAAPQPSDGPPLGVIFTLLLLLIGGALAALSPKQQPIVLNLPPPNIPPIEQYRPVEKFDPIPPSPPTVWPIPTYPIGPAIVCTKDKQGGGRCTIPHADPSAPTNPPRAQQVLPTPQSPPLPAPNTGVIQGGFHKRKLHAPFIIETQSATDYLIKLVKTTDPKNRIMIYVRGGETYRDSVPLGSYRIRAASGTTWYGKDHLFGPNTQFFRFQQKGSTGPDGAVVLNFKQQRNQLLGVTLSLRNVVDGNMQQQTISRQEFEED